METTKIGIEGFTYEQKEIIREIIKEELEKERGQLSLQIMKAIKKVSEDES